MDRIHYRDGPPTNAFLRRSKRSGFCQPDLPEFEQLLEERDDELFDKIKYNPNQACTPLAPSSAV